MKKLNILGQRFSQLTVVGTAPSRRFFHSDGRLRSTRAFWRCRCDCGVEKEFPATLLLNRKRHCCGCERNGGRGEKHFNWKGGRQRTDKGYIKLTRPVFPGSDKTTSETTLEHVVVMARHLGRPLHKGETVHHKNGIRDDNDLKNLELRASQHGPGQRVEDLVVWAKEILARYDAPTVSPCCV